MSAVSAQPDEVVAGNVYPKYTTRNPLARLLVAGFQADLRALVQRSGARQVHEVGCGEGFLARRLAADGYRVRGSDLSPATIAEACRRSAGMTPPIAFKVADLYRLDPDRDASELIVCCEVLEHLPDTARALDVLGQLARPHLIASVPKEPLWRILNVARGRYWSELGNTPGHLQHWSGGRLHFFARGALRGGRGPQSLALDHGALPSPRTVIVPPDVAVRIGRLIGWAAVAASLGFVGLQLWQHAPWRLAGAHLEVLTAAIVGGALLYGLAGLLLSSAWYQLLDTGSGTASLRCHHAVYGRTQIAKYLPGNVFHLVGRQVMGRRLGHGQGRLALASLLEALLLVLVAGAFCLPLVWHWLDQALLWIGAFAAPALVLIAVRWNRNQRSALCHLEEGVDRDPMGAALRLLRAAALYTLFFLVVAAIFWMLALSVSESGRPSIGFAGSIPVVTLAWLVGFVTPGSSAGIGVREAVLIAALEGTLGAPASTLIALALRLVTVGGDVVFFTLGVTVGLARGRPQSIALGDDPA